MTKQTEQDQGIFKYRIVVEYENEILGSGVFWEGPAENINEIRNTPARRVAETVAKDGETRTVGMWAVWRTQ